MGKLFGISESIRCLNIFSLLAAMKGVGAVENDQDALVSGAARLEVQVDAQSAAQLVVFQRQLLAWNQRVNLIARASAGDVLEKHLIDSLAAAVELDGVQHLIDIGSGAGLPGIALKILLPHLRVTLIESIGKKVAFLTHAAARLNLGAGLEIKHLRAEGRPEQEGVTLADAAISRALMNVGSWLKLAVAYVRPGGRVLAMLAGVDESALEKAASAAGVRLSSVRRYVLPFSKAPRAIARFDR